MLSKSLLRETCTGEAQGKNRIQEWQCTALLTKYFEVPTNGAPPRPRPPLKVSFVNKNLCLIQTP